MLRNFSRIEPKKYDIFADIQTHTVIHDGKSQTERLEDSQRQEDQLIKNSDKILVNDIARESPTKKQISPKKKHKSQTSVSLSWVSSIQKISTSIASARLFGKNPGEILFCCSVDGSPHSDYMFDVVTENFLKKFSKLLCVHIFNSNIDTILNYSNKKSTVLEKYANNIARLKDQAHFVTEDKVSQTHVLEQVLRHCVSYQANYLICGYSGLKGPRGDNRELTEGIHFLLSVCRTPTIIIKEKGNRIDGEGYKWLLVLDRQWTNCFRAFNAFAPLFNASLDTVNCLAFYPSALPKVEDLKTQFEAGCDRYSLMNSSYEGIAYSKRSVGVLAAEKVNFGEERYDFIIFYNNSGHYKENPEISDGAYLIERTKSNICFLNN